MQTVETTPYHAGDAQRPALTLTPLGQGRYEVDMAGAAFYRLHPQAGEHLDAGKFFPGDPEMDGRTVEIIGPFRKRKVDYHDGFELRFRFKIRVREG